MEEGPEPHEWVEKTAEEHHHGHEHGSEARGNDMIFGHHRRGACRACRVRLAALRTCRQPGDPGPDQGHRPVGYYQAKSTKGHVYLVGSEIIKALSASQNAANDSHASSLGISRRNPSLRPRKGGGQERGRAPGSRESARVSQAPSVCPGHRLLPGRHRAGLGLDPRAPRAIYYLSVVAGAAGLVWTVTGLLG